MNNFGLFQAGNCPAHGDKLSFRGLAGGKIEGIMEENIPTEVHVKTPCPICGGQNLELKERLDHYNLVRCVSCDLIFSDPMQAADGSAYDRAYRIRHFVIDNRIRDYYRWTLRRTQPGQRLLDLGCGEGVFVAYARRRGREAYGLDFSRRAIAVGKNFRRNEWIRVGTIHELPRDLWPSEYDMVTALEVVEHLEDPRAILDEIRLCLKPGGVVVFSVPNRDCWPITKFDDYPPHHLTRWTRRSLCRLLESAGYQVEECRPTSRLRSLNAFWAYLSRWVLYGLFGMQGALRSMDISTQQIQAVDRNDNSGGQPHMTVASRLLSMLRLRQIPRRPRLDSGDPFLAIAHLVHPGEQPDDCSQEERFMSKVVGALTVILAISSAFYVLPALPAALLGLVWVIDLILQRRKLRWLVGLLLLNYGYWLASVGWTSATINWAFIRWQAPLFIGFLPLFAWLTPHLRGSLRTMKLVTIAFLGAAASVVLIGMMQYWLGYRQTRNFAFGGLAFRFDAVRYSVGEDFFMGFFRSHTAAGGYFCLATVLSLAFLLFCRSTRMVTAGCVGAGLLSIWCCCSPSHVSSLRRRWWAERCYLRYISCKVSVPRLGVRP